MLEYVIINDQMFVKYQLLKAERAQVAQLSEAISDLFDLFDLIENADIENTPTQDLHQYLNQITDARKAVKGDDE